MVISKGVEEEIDLDKIDEEMKMEKIRQTAAKLSWEGFGQSLRKNLMDKKMVFESDARMDMLVALSVMRKGLPVDEKSDLTAKLRQLSDSLECQFSVQPGVVCMKNSDLCIEVAVDGQEVKGCQISYFSQSPTLYPELSNLIASGSWDVIRSSVHSILSAVPVCHSQQDRVLFAESLTAFENWLASQNIGVPSFEALNTLACGGFVARTPLRPSRIFYIAEPSYVIGTGRYNLDPAVDFDILPYLELSISLCDKEILMPTTVSGDPWSSARSLRGCFTLKFSTPMVFSAATWRNLEPLLAKQSIVRQHVNVYRYLSNFDLKEPMLELRTCFSGDRVQHLYQMERAELRDERDVIVADLHLKCGKDLAKVISLVRTQAQHNSFFESVLAMCIGRFPGGRATKVRFSPSARSFELVFATDDQVYVARINFVNNMWRVFIEGMDGSSISESINNEATNYINKCWSIPVTLCRIFTLLNVEGDSGSIRVKEEMEVENSVPKKCDKVGFAWSSRPNTKKKKSRQKFSFRVIEPEDKPAGLLAMFKQPDEVKELIPPIRTRDRDTREDFLSTRSNHRTLFDNSLAKNAFSDLEAICQLAESMEDDSRGSPMSARGLPLGSGTIGGGGPYGSASASPVSRPSVTPSTTPGLGPVGHTLGQPQLSPLESARQRITQAVSSDAFDFPDDRSNSSVGSFPSPLGSSQLPLSYTPSYNMSAASSPMSALGGPPSLTNHMRGAAPKRRGRGRKIGNVGDRMPDGSILTAADVALQQAAQAAKKTRAVRRPRGSRKASGLPDHIPYDQRPQLQRSFSDAQYTQPPTPKSTSSSMEKVDSPYVESESDDGETDPPPPPKNIGGYPQQPSISTPINLSSVLPLVSPLMSSSSIITATVPPSPAVAAMAAVAQTSSLSSASSSPSHAQRKNSLENVVGKISKNSVCSQPKKSKISDLYDNGLDSPPSGSEKKASPLMQKEIARSVQNSPHPFPSPSHADFSLNSALTSSTDPEKLSTSAPEKKIILKISQKVPSRASPSVELMKNKQSSSSSSLTSMIPKQSFLDKAERSEKKEKKERKEIFGPKCAKIAAEERRKRKLEEKEKSREHKKHKLGSGGLEKDRDREKDRERDKEKEHEKQRHREKERERREAEKSAPAPSLMPFGIGNFQKFKIPKKNTADVDVSMPTAPISTVPPSLLRPMERRDIEREKDNTEKMRSKKLLSKHSDPKPPSSVSSRILNPPINYIPLPAGPPPSQPSGSSRKGPELPRKLSSSSVLPPLLPLNRPPTVPKTGSTRWVAPPSSVSKQRERSLSPDPEAMQIDDASSPDGLRIADD